MATSYIKYKDKGFWVNDTFTELAVEYLISTIREQDVIDLWLQDYIKDKLFYISKGYFSSFINLGFEDYLKSESDVAYFITVIEQTIATLKRKGDFLSKDELNNFIIDVKLQSKFTTDFPSWTVIETLKRFKQLLLGMQPSQEEIFL